MYIISNHPKSPNTQSFDVYAHRGASQIAPENTLAALIIAAQAGAKQIEFDVRLTKDDVPVIFHDSKLHRTSSGSGYLSRTHYEHLSQLDAGSWFDAQFSDERIPTLAQWLQRAAQLRLKLNIELKVQSKHQARVMAVLLVSHLNQYWPKDLSVPLISSSYLYILKCVASESKNTLPLALISNRLFSKRRLRKLIALGFFSVHHKADSLNPHYVDSCHEKGLRVLAYTVNDESTALALKSQGVDGIFTDNTVLYLLQS